MMAVGAYNGLLASALMGQETVCRRLEGSASYISRGRSASGLLPLATPLSKGSQYP